MADLQQILGAILRDLAKARFSSDLYSRSIARYYENDFLLRKFPVPRADIEEVEIDLKFSITDIDDSDVNHESREANAALLFERSVERLVSTFLSLAEQREKSDPALEEKRRKYVVKGFNSTVLRIEMRQKLLRYFIESFPHLVDDGGAFDAQAALGDMERPLRWAMEDHAHDIDRGDPDLAREMKGALHDLIAPVLQSKEIVDAVDAMGPALSAIWRANSDVRLDVLVQGSQLAQLGEAAISSVKIKAGVRNLIWTEVKVDDRKTRTTLTAE